MTHVTDHPFTPKPGEEWGLCRHRIFEDPIEGTIGATIEAYNQGRDCGLAAPTHENVPDPYVPTATRRLDADQGGGRSVTENGEPPQTPVASLVSADHVDQFGGKLETDDPAYGLADPITRTVTHKPRPLV